MTDPDDRRSRSRSMTPPVASTAPPIAFIAPTAVPQPNFLADVVDLNAHRLHSINLQPSTSGALAVPANAISLNDPEDPFGFHDGPRHNNILAQRLSGYGVNIPPEVQLPANWDAKSHACNSTNANPS
jgi:hypothetical protein